jgi:hypothetical protein
MKIKVLYLNMVLGVPVSITLVRLAYHGRYAWQSKQLTLLSRKQRVRENEKGIQNSF